MDVGEATETDFGQQGKLVAVYHPPYRRGVIQYSGVVALAQHLVKVALIDSQSVAFDYRAHKGRTLTLAHRRQLSLVADEQQTAVAPLVNEAYEVVKEATHATEHTAVAHRGRNHRGLVDYEEGVLHGVVVQGEHSAIAV